MFCAAVDAWFFTATEQEEGEEVVAIADPEAGHGVGGGDGAGGAGNRVRGSDTCTQQLPTQQQLTIRR